MPSKSSDVLNVRFFANHTQDNARAVGGRISVESDALGFTPNALDIRLGGRAVRIEKREIAEITVEPRNPSLQELFTGGLRERLKVVRNDGRAELFVVDRLPSVVAALQKWRNE